MLCCQRREILCCWSGKVGVGLRGVLSLLCGVMYYFGFLLWKMGIMILDIVAFKMSMGMSTVERNLFQKPPSPASPPPNLSCSVFVPILLKTVLVAWLVCFKRSHCSSMSLIILIQLTIICNMTASCWICCVLGKEVQNYYASARLLILSDP